MARSASPRPDDYDCLCFPATPPPRTRGAEKKESAGLRLNQLCPPYVAPSSISFFGRRLSGVHTAGNRFVKNRITNRFCQSSVRACIHKPVSVTRRRLRPFCPDSDQARATAQYVAKGQKQKSGAGFRSAIPDIFGICRNRIAR